MSFSKTLNRLELNSDISLSWMRSSSGQFFTNFPPTSSPFSWRCFPMKNTRFGSFTWIYWISAGSCVFIQISYLLQKKFAESFCKHYFRVSMLILHPTERFVRNADRDIFYNKLANAVVHVSVQLFSNENLALLLCQRLKLLYTIIISLKFAVEGNRKNYWGILVPNLLLNPEETQLEIEGPSNSKGEAMGENLPTTETVPRVVCCEHSILRLHRFWPIVSDLNNLFSHSRIALQVRFLLLPGKKFKLKIFYL